MSTTIEKPIALRDEDVVGVFSPSDALSGNRQDRVRSGCDRLSQAGFQTLLSPNVFAKDGTMAGSIKQRISDISLLLADPKIKAMFPTWGGKACNQLIYDLPYREILQTKKIWLGFSDIAVLLNAITAKTGLITFYGPNIVGKLDETDHWALRLVREPVIDPGSNILANATKGEYKCLRPGIARGRLFGGNLNCFVLGVACAKIDLGVFDGGIFFWEDLGLTPRQVDQHLTALRNSGLLDRISGMVVGDFIAREAENRETSNPFDSVLHPSRDYKFPILYAPVFGHRRLENPIFPIGAMCELDAEASTLVMLERCVVRR
jgi:muramoyltetrapeptide carboxypeptidase